MNIVAYPSEKNPSSHRTKMPRIPSSLLRRRTLNRPKRYRRRSSTPFRTIVHSNTTRQREYPTAAPSMTSNHRQKHSTHRSVANQLYHEIQFPSEDLFAYPLEFEEILGYYPDDNEQEELIQQVFSTSENGELLPQVKYFLVFDPLK